MQFAFPGFRRTRATLLLLAGLVAVSGAQAQTASVRGTVRSQSGAPLGGVAVRFEPGSATAGTDSAGRFSLTIPAGMPGVLRFTLDQFGPEALPVPAMAAGAVREVTLTLRAAYQLDALSVVAQPPRPLLNSRDAATGGAIESAEIAALPSEARNLLALLYNIPGVAQATSYFGDAPPLSLNGANSLYTQYLLDGLDNNEGFLGGPRVEFPLAGIDRISALVNSYSPEWGRSSNGLVNSQSRAGSAEHRSELFAWYRPGRPFDARNKAPFGGQPEAIARQQDGFRRFHLGGSWSGPIVRDRTFGSGAVEYSNENEDRIGSTALAPFLGTEKRETVKLFGRMDHGWSPTQTTTLRFALSDVSRAGQGSGVVTPEADITTRRVGSLTALTHRSALRGGRAANTASAQLGTFRWYFPPTRSDFSRPQVTVVTPALETQAIVGSSNFVFDETEHQLQVRDVIETEVGRHTLRAGADAVTAWFKLSAAGTNPNGSYVVFNDGNIPVPPGRALSINDIPGTARVLSYTVDAGPQQVDLTQSLVGAFIEDQWRVSPRLVLNLGVRWDYDDITSRGESSPDLNNFQPRLSFNWLRSPSSVLRGGVGMYAGKLPYAVYSDAIQLGPDGNALVTFTGADAPAYLQGPSQTELQQRRQELPPTEQFRTFALGLEQPMSYQASLGWQRQFGQDWSVAIDGVMSTTRNLPRNVDLNPSALRIGAGDVTNRPCASAFECPADASRPVQPVAGGYRRLSTTESGGRADYVALYTAVRRRLNNAWTVDANWVWSHAKTDAEDINFAASQANCFGSNRVDAVTGEACTSQEWADANNDRRHKVTLRTVYTMGASARFGLIADYQSGLPVTRLAGTSSPSGNAQYDLLGIGPVRGNAFIGDANRFFGVPRNGERLPGYFNLSASATWFLHFGATDVELRADGFNLLNRTEWSGFASGIGGGGSRTQYGSPGDPLRLFSPGPPRQFQFSARWTL